MTTKKIIYRDDHLLEEEINDRKYKVRAILMNDKKEIILEKYAGIYMFPGGSIESNESPLETLKRELEEETGIDDARIQTVPFLQIEEYNRHFPKRDGIHHVNRYTKTLFYFAFTKQNINKRKMHLSSLEKNFKFTCQFVPLTDIDMLLKEKQEKSFKDKYFYREITTVLQNLPKIEISEE